MTRRGELIYLLNHGVEASMSLAPGSWTDLLTGEAFTGDAPLGLRAVRILKPS